MQVNNLAAQIKSRQAELAALTAQRNTMLAGIAGAKTPAEKASRQNALDAIDAKIAALNGAIAGNQNAMNNDKAQIAKLDALKPC
jgi:chromosome segregation ATPase